jgi:pyruvate/2-oxoglutarate dehydrogenase complex dihydrolipoamide acyltransferase (E2) component
MGKIVEVRVPLYPDCWETCGSCAQGDISVEEVLVQPGDMVQFDDNVIVLETGKIALDIQSPHAGRVVEVFVAVGDEVAEGALILTIETG